MRTVEQVIRSDASVAPPSSSDDGLALHLIVVEWQDITAYAGWETHEEATLTSFKTVGWLVFSDDVVVKVSAEPSGREHANSREILAQQRWRLS